MLSEEITRLRNRIITGTYAIGPEGKEPTNWQDYALKLESHILKLELTMIAAAEEIQQHWQAHCDEDGYGPSNLMHRLENGIAANYEGYKSGQFTKLQNENLKLQNILIEDFIKNKGDAINFQKLDMTPMQISVYALNCPKEDKYFEEVADLIERYADTKVYKELEAPYEEFENKVLKTLKSMTLSMAAHPDCVKGSEFFDLVSIAEKVIEGTLDTRDNLK